MSSSEDFFNSIMTRAEEGDEEAQDVLKILEEVQKGNAKACFQLAEIFHDGMYGAEQNEDLALIWHKKSAELGYTKAKLKIEEIIEAFPEPFTPKYLFRTESWSWLSPASVGNMISEFGFYCNGRLNDSPVHGYADDYMDKFGKGIENKFELSPNRLVAVDTNTGLFWQTSPSYEMPHDSTEDYINELNTRKWGGYNDWRLPTLPEGMSLLKKKLTGISFRSGYHIDSIFHPKPWTIWTSDKDLNFRDLYWHDRWPAPRTCWIVCFSGVENGGYCELRPKTDFIQVLAVRSEHKKGLIELPNLF